jgi:hypothetical protein
MICSERVTELVECARSGAVLNRDLRAHMNACGRCRERWDAERQLSVHLGKMRLAATTLQSPESRREALMGEFSRKHRVTPMPSRAVPSWAWTLAAAAAIVLAIFVGHEAGIRSHPAVSPAARTHGSGVQNIQNAVLYEASMDASALSTDDFVAIPYTPPLAQGEMVRMVHADMYPEALASLGVAVDPEWTGNMPVDIVVGGDGMPRAVRMSDNGN